MINPLHRHRDDPQGVAIHPHTLLIPRSSPPTVPNHDLTFDPDSPLSAFELQRTPYTNSDEDWNNPRDSYGSGPYSGEETSSLLTAEPDTDAKSISNTNSDHPASTIHSALNPLAIVFPLIIILILLITFFLLRPSALFRCSCLRSRSNRRKPTTNVQTLATDLEAAGRPPRVLSPSVPLPTREPREHERGWLFMPQLGVPNWVRGYRRRSDPQGEGDPDWQLDVNEVGEAPPEYTLENEEDEKVELGTRVDRSMTGETRESERLPQYNEVEGLRPERQDEVSSREADRDGGQGESDVGDGKNGHL